MLTTILVAQLALVAGGAPQEALQVIHPQAGEPLAAPGTPSRRFGIDQDRPLLGVMLSEAEGGARVAEVVQGTAAEAAGLRAGDILVRVGGQNVRAVSDVLAQLGLRKAGDPLTLVVRRGDETLEFVAELRGAPARSQVRIEGPPSAGQRMAPAERPPAPAPPPAASDERPFLGVTLEVGQQGLRISGLTQGGAAEAAGLLPGDRLLAIDGHEVGDYDALVERLEASSVGDFVVVKVERSGRGQELLVELGSRPAPGMRAPQPGLRTQELEVEDDAGGPLRIRINGEDVDPQAFERADQDGLELEFEFEGEGEDLGEQLERWLSDLGGGQGGGRLHVQRGLEGLEGLGELLEEGEFEVELEELLSQPGAWLQRGGGQDLLERLGGMLEGVDVEELELHAEQLAEQAERFAEQFGEQAEEWAEGMEFWAESFADQSDLWSDVLEAQSERFAEQFEDLDLELQVNGRSLRDLLGGGTGGRLGGQRGSESVEAGRATRLEVRIDEDGNRTETVMYGTPDGRGGWSWSSEPDGPGTIVTEELVERGPGGGAHAMRPAESAGDPLQAQLDQLRAELQTLRRENEELRRRLDGQR